MPKILVTTVPFGDKNPLPLVLLREAGIEYQINPLNKKLTESELVEMVPDFDVIIAGTEPITSRVIKAASRLKLISRVGIGLDSVDLLAARARGIQVSYTPDAPGPAVAELTVGLILNLLRSIHLANAELHQGIWSRHFGRRLAEATVGVVGVGRIGSNVLSYLKGFGVQRILANDISPKLELNKEFEIEWTDKEDIYKRSDVITVHVPLTHLTRNMIQKKDLFHMKKDAVIINTARGGIINENDLYEVMRAGHLAGAAIDVFDFEPYSGKLMELERCLLTAHMGSMSVDCRAQMEIEATEEAIRFLNNRPLEFLVPEAEYETQMQRGLR